MNPDGFLGLDWKSIGVTVLVSTITATMTAILVEELTDLRKKHRGKGPRQRGRG